MVWMNGLEFCPENLRFSGTPIVRKLALAGSIPYPAKTKAALV